MLLFCDGMDHYNLAQTPAKWNLGNTMLYTNNNGRFGGGSLQYDVSNFEKSAARTITSGSNFVVGFAFRLGTSMPASATSFIRLNDSGTTQTELRYGTSGQIAVYTNGSQVGASANGLITLGVWNFIEWKVTIAASTGTNQCVVRLNGVEIINLVGVATMTTSNTTANAISIGRVVSTQCDFRYDDIYVCDSTGSMNNDFLGDCRIETLYPGAAGNYTQFTANGAATNWQATSETPADDDTSFVNSNNVNDKDSYAFTNPSGTITTVFAIQVCMRARKDNAGARTFARLVRIAGTDYVGSEFSLGTDYQLFTEIIELSPNTSANWTSSEITALEAGVKVIS